MWCVTLSDVFVVTVRWCLMHMLVSELGNVFDVIFHMMPPLPGRGALYLVASNTAGI